VARLAAPAPGTDAVSPCGLGNEIGAGIRYAHSMIALKYAVLVYATIAYGIILGDNWHWYAMALMLAAIRSHYVRTVLGRGGQPRR
jgi:hypothetical protein